jgi:succinate-semialdehyde dehydrogenase/glutarate-semialdehyde dehydrogenase/succinyl-CoA reductase
MQLKSINPANEKIIGEFELFSKEKVFKVVENAKRALEFWKKTEISEREKFVKNFLRALGKEKKKIARLITIEMGKPLSEARDEMEGVLEMAEWFLLNTRKYIKDEEIFWGSRASARIKFEPVGVVGAITPWNFPLSTSLQKIIPALLTGNTVVFKPSELSTPSGLKIAQMFKKINLPKNVFNITTGDARTGKFLVSARVNMISFTGSTAAGKNIAQTAGKDLKKVVLELGGSDPFIVFEDADLNKAVDGAILGRFENCGQVCIAAKRIFVHKKIYPQFLEKFLKRVKLLKVGNPLNTRTEIGPLVSKDQLKDLEIQVKDAISRGAKLLAGGKRIKRRGYFYEPTVLADIVDDMLVAKEEVFGPVACIFSFEGLDRVLQMANNTKYGLGASVWTKDKRKIKFITENIESGMISVNSWGTHTLECPFGGVKESGLGRELSKYGIWEFCNIKTIIQ